MRASSSLELPETSMVKNLQKKSSNGCENNANGFRTYIGHVFVGFFWYMLSTGTFWLQVNGTN
jgi:hypothetical protein